MNSHESLTLYPAPAEEEPAVEHFHLTVDGQPVFLYKARVSAYPLNQVWPGYQRPLEQTEIASFATWDMGSPVEVVIESTRLVREVRVRPSARGIQPVVDGSTIRFTLDRPGQITVEVNGTHHALHLFANPPEDAPPDPKDPNVRFFGPGVHCPGPMRMESNQTIYLAGGAVVYGCILAEGADNITIRGRGILDGSKFDRFDPTTSLIRTKNCTGVTIEGIIFRDPCTWTLVPTNCREVRIRNIKLIGLWRYNADGVDFVNSQHCSIEDSFVRSFDDSIVFKGLHRADLEPVEDIQTRRCVLWCDWGRALEIGAETVTPQIHDLLFEDCDIIHTTHVAMDVQNGDRGTVRDVLFRDIRVELDDDFTRFIMQEYPGQPYDPGSEPYIAPLIVLEIIDCMWSKDTRRGQIEDIRFENIRVTAPSMPVSNLRGFDADHQVRRIRVKNLTLNGAPVTDLQAGGFTTNEFVQDVTLEP